MRILLALVCGGVTCHERSAIEVNYFAHADADADSDAHLLGAAFATAT